MTASVQDQANREEMFARIRLLRSPNVGPVTYAQLLRRFETAVAALDALPDLARRGARAYRAADVSRVEDEIAAVRRADARYLFHDSPDYPALLREIEGAPPILTVRGNAALVHRPCIAMVGARNVSAAAVKLARDFAAALGEAGFVVVSGLARGIDGAAHRGSLPATIGVIASGIDIAYPPEHRDLQEQVAAEGLLVAEQPPGTLTPGSAFPIAQSHHRRARGRHAGGRSRAAFRIADHRTAGGRGGARGDGDPRLSARSAQPRLQPVDPRRRDAGAIARRCHRTGQRL